MWSRFTRLVVQAEDCIFVCGHVIAEHLVNKCGGLDETLCPPLLFPHLVPCRAYDPGWDGPDSRARDPPEEILEVRLHEMSRTLVEASGSELLAPPCDPLGRFAEDVDEISAHPPGGREGVVPHTVTTKDGYLVVGRHLLRRARLDEGSFLADGLPRLPRRANGSPSRARIEQGQP